MFSRRSNGSASKRGRGSKEGSSERRQRRSDQLFEALRLQIRHTQQRLSLDALVLTDDMGEIVASAGQDELVHEVAVQSPWLAATSAWDLDGALSYLWKVYPGLRSNRFCLKRVELEGFDEPLILCGVGHTRELDMGVAHTATGVERILLSKVN